ncbi:MAG: class I SAM-dependent methyltransferase [Solirubrobacteraceae bacterium]
MKRPSVLNRALLASVRTFNQNPWTSGHLELVPSGARFELLPKEDGPFYAEDGLWTHHGHSFVDDDRFQRAYERAVSAGGFDYRIRWRVHTLLWAASTAASVDGAFVECGTGRGFMASAVCEYLGWEDRPFYLFDTFDGTTLDTTDARAAGVSPYYATSVDEVRENFARWPGTRLVVGKLPASLSRAPDQVAFLHVDLNHPSPEQMVVRHFWPRMAEGAVLVFDDYGFGGYESSRRAADEVSDELGFSILASPTGQGIVVKTKS